ncbi:hypothetical protein KSP40_PGU004610 [Platanthera guangdongensis]|uniref:Uncharacterized protein n=1 Tax=Platanthera guangdongensis TaxID=2320717 RepID=A0ABR2LFX7_9ASPA
MATGLLLLRRLPRATTTAVSAGDGVAGLESIIAERHFSCPVETVGLGVVGLSLVLAVNCATSVLLSSSPLPTATFQSAPGGATSGRASSGVPADFRRSDIRPGFIPAADL